MALSYHVESRGDYAQYNNQSFISTDIFNDDIYSYSSSLNAIFQTVGTLKNLSDATASNCPAGNVLHVTGKRLIPSVNPMNTFPAAGGLSTGSFPGVFLLGVYDPVSGLRGFIDPTNVKFAKFDQNLPNFYDTGIHVGSLPLLGGKGGKLNDNSSTQVRVVVFTSKTASGNATTYEAGNASCGMFMPLDFNRNGGGVAITADASNNTFNVGGSVRINTTAVKTTSNIFLTPCGNTASLVAYPGNSDGYFTIYLGPISALGPGGGVSDGICLSWMIVN